MKYDIELVEASEESNVRGDALKEGVYVTDGTIPDDEKKYLLIVGYCRGRVGFSIDGGDKYPRDWSSTEYDSRTFHNVRPVKSFHIKVNV